MCPACVCVLHFSCVVHHHATHTRAHTTTRTESTVRTGTLTMLRRLLATESNPRTTSESTAPSSHGWGPEPARYLQHTRTYSVHGREYTHTHTHTHTHIHTYTQAHMHSHRTHATRAPVTSQDTKTPPTLRSITMRSRCASAGIMLPPLYENCDTAPRLNPQKEKEERQKKSKRSQEQQEPRHLLSTLHSSMRHA